MGCDGMDGRRGVGSVGQHVRKGGNHKAIEPS